MSKNLDATDTFAPAAMPIATGANADPLQPGLTHADVLRKLMTDDPVASPVEAAQQAPQKTTAKKAISTALSRAAENLYNLPTSPHSVEISEISMAELSELLPEQALLAIIEGGNEDLGIVALCANTVGCLIEMQAVGRISSRPIRPRKPTRTDAVITVDFVSALLKELGKELKNRAGMVDFSSFSYASFMDDPRPMLLMLEDGPMLCISIRYSLGPTGQREGQAIIALPLQPNPVMTGAAGGLMGLTRHSPDGPDENHTTTTPPVSPPSTPTPPASPTTSARTLAKAVSQAPMPIVGVLCRKTLTLAALKNLSPGDLIPLPPGTLDHARIETTGGQLLALGRFGEADGYHAIRLHARAARMGEEGDALDGHSPGNGGAAQERQRPDLADPVLRDVDLSQPDDFRSRGSFQPGPDLGHPERNGGDIDTGPPATEAFPPPDPRQLPAEGKP